MDCAGRKKRHHPRRGSGEEQSQFWERWVAETESFCGKIWLERRDKVTARSAEPQRGEASTEYFSHEGGEILLGGFRHWLSLQGLGTPQLMAS